jgi:hypothetical protein
MAVLRLEGSEKWDNAGAAVQVFLYNVQAFPQVNVPVSCFIVIHIKIKR